MDRGVKFVLDNFNKTLDFINNIFDNNKVTARIV